MQTFLFHPTPQRKQMLKSTADAAGVSMGEVLRLLIDYAHDNPMTLNTIFPHASGHPWHGGAPR